MSASAGTEKLGDLRGICNASGQTEEDLAGSHVARMSRPKPLGQSLRNLDLVIGRLQVEANFLREFAIVTNDENETPPPGFGSSSLNTTNST